MEKLKRKVDADASFEAVAREYHKVKSTALSASYSDRWISIMEKDVFPWLGSLPLASVTAPMLPQVLRCIGARGAHETPQRFWRSRTSTRRRFASRPRLDWSLRASEALNNDASQAVNVFQQTEQLITRAFGGMEDAIVSLVMTGKTDFKTLINSILSDIARLTIRLGITGPIAKMIAQALAPDELGDLLKNKNIAGGGGNGGGSFNWGSLFSNVGSWFGGLFADGGNPPVGVPSLVGERGPELFVPNIASTIVPNEALGGGGWGAPIINNYAPARVSVERRPDADHDRGDRGAVQRSEQQA